MALFNTHTLTTDKSKGSDRFALRTSHDTCKSNSTLDDKSFSTLLKNNPNLKEYTIDEFLRKIKYTLNLFENGKYCTKCKNMKDIEEFGKAQNWCKECKNTSFKEYYNRNKERMKQNLKNDYEKRKQLIMCDCGAVIYFVSYKSHLKSKCHYNLLKEKNFLNSY